MSEANPSWDDIPIVDEIEVDEITASLLSAGMIEVKRQRDEMIRKGIIDEDDNLLIHELPPDMIENSKTEV